MKIKVKVKIKIKTKICYSPDYNYYKILKYNYNKSVEHELSRVALTQRRNARERKYKEFAKCASKEIRL